MEHESDDDTSCNWWTRNDPQMLDKGAGRVGNQRSNSIVEVDQNTGKSPGHSASSETP